MPLTNFDRQTIIEARALADADSTAQLVEVLRRFGSPTVSNARLVSASTAHAAALGQAQAILGELADRIEALDAELTAARADAELWGVWWVDLEACRAREVEHAPRKMAREMALRLAETAPLGVGYIALPLGGLPFDDPDLQARAASYQASNGVSEVTR